MGCVPVIEATATTTTGLVGASIIIKIVYHPTVTISKFANGVGFVVTCVFECAHSSVIGASRRGDTIAHGFGEILHCGNASRTN